MIDEYVVHAQQMDKVQVHEWIGRAKASYTDNPIVHAKSFMEVYETIW